jgi:hypothetical protein
MQYTTHGLMTPADLADHQKLTDTGPHPDCLGHDDGPGDQLSYCAAAMDCSYTSGDFDDVQAYDLQAPAPGGAPEPMDAARRFAAYTTQNGSWRLTPRQRRRAVKKAGRDPEMIVLRDDGMGFSPAKQGYRQIVGNHRSVQPVSGAPV